MHGTPLWRTGGRTKCSGSDSGRWMRMFARYFFHRFYAGVGAHFVAEGPPGAWSPSRTSTQRAPNSKNLVTNYTTTSTRRISTISSTPLGVGSTYCLDLAHYRACLAVVGRRPAESKETVNIITANIYMYDNKSYRKDIFKERELHNRLDDQRKRWKDEKNKGEREIKTKIKSR
jgi:hypothetical protein